MTALYFAYGSNMSTPRLRARIERAAPVGRGWLDGYRLAFNKRGNDGSGKANLILDPMAQAWGVLFRIGPSDWTTLDGFEVGYRRESCRVHTGTGEPSEARCYLAVAPEDRDISPLDWYRAHCLEGAREHGLPASAVESIERGNTLEGRA